MIYDVFLPFIIIFSFFSIIIILARKIPDISFEPEVKKDQLAEKAKKQHRMTVLFCKALSLLEKTLRHLRIHILKLDAKIFSLIQYLREKSTQKLEEINKLSYMTFVPTLEKKANKTHVFVKPKVQPPAKPQVQPVIKPQFEAVKKLQKQPKKEFQVIEKDILPVKPVQTKPVLVIPPAPKMTATTADKAIGYANKIATKFNYKIEERKLLVTIARNPKIAENYKKLGMLYYNNENYLDTEASFIEYLKLNPTDSEVRELMKKVSCKNQGKN